MLTALVIVIKLDGFTYKVRRVDDKYYQSMTGFEPELVSRDTARVLATTYYESCKSRDSICVCLDQKEYDQLRGAEL